ncbi:MAG: UDP-N-acetylmuramoyl-tripeptide--D-alanyl-D-alanine ligase [Bacillota bacterium]|nr:UDP-N-acetylmuramoyl-tripeptide--D-alanyl-D-alanine ligase [Bacillota bacterium]
MLFTVEEVIRITRGKLWWGEPKGAFHGALIDSRAVEGGELFFPLQGDKADGHNFILDALKKGARGSLLERDKLSLLNTGMIPEGKVVIVVENSIHSLQKLASYHRNKFSLPIIAVTGSSGKTTTKDLIASVLSTRYNMLKTEGNLNNHLGVPLTLLRLREEHQAAVMELGMSGLGEIALLTSLTKPAFGVITNIGEAHLGLLGSIDNIARAKGELLKTMGPQGKALLNGDDPLLRAMGDKFEGKSFYYGFEDGADLRALSCSPHDMGYGFEAAFPNGEMKSFWIPLLGKHNVYNALAAAAVGFHFSLEPDEIKKGLAVGNITKLRMEKTLVKGGFWVINDSYNANPASMKAALHSLKESAQNNVSIAVLGEMLELGSAAEEKHFEVGKYLAFLGIDLLITLGTLASHISQGAREAGFPPEKIIEASSNREVIEGLESIHLPGAFILIKGSRGMKMEKIAEELLAKHGTTE